MPRPFQSFGDVTNRADSALADLIHAFFDRFENLCPRFVPQIPSILVGLIVFNVLMTLSLDAVLLEKKTNSTSSDPSLRMRWILFLLLAVAISLWISDKVQKKVYMMHSIELNKDHFALVFWLEQYMSKLKGSQGIRITSLRIV